MAVRLSAPKKEKKKRQTKLRYFGSTFSTQNCDLMVNVCVLIGTQYFRNVAKRCGTAARIGRMIWDRFNTVITGSKPPRAMKYFCVALYDPTEGGALRWADPRSEGTK
jgi:hypothetical protein